MVDAAGASTAASQSMPVFLTYNPVEDAALTTPTTTSSSPGGFVQALATYIVMDDLTITPISTMGIFSKLNGKDNRLVVEVKHSVQLGAKQVNFHRL